MAGPTTSNCLLMLPMAERVNYLGLHIRQWELGAWACGDSGGGSMANRMMTGAYMFIESIFPPNDWLCTYLSGRPLLISELASILGTSVFSQPTIL